MPRDYTNKAPVEVVRTATRVVDPSFLQVDPSYQRDVVNRHKRIMADFNPDAMGVPLVGQREDGSCWIVDGQQRITAIKKLGHKTVTVRVFRSLGPEHEAQIFKIVNMDRTGLKSREEFKALLTGHDEDAWAVHDVAKKYGYSIPLGKSGSSTHELIPGERAARELTCTSTMLRVVKKWGTDPLAFTLRVISQAWPVDRRATHNIVVDGFCTFFNRLEGIVDEDRLVARLQQPAASAQKLLYAANQAVLGNSKGSAFADALEKLYSKRQAKKKKES